MLLSYFLTVSGMVKGTGDEPCVSSRACALYRTFISVLRGGAPILMNIRTLAAGIAAVPIFVCSSADNRSADSARYGEFIAGFSLLQSPQFARRPAFRCARFRELQQCTGVTAAEALRYLEIIREDPGKGEKLYEAMQNALSEQKKPTASK